MLGEPCEIAVRYINVVRSVRPFREREGEGEGARLARGDGMEEATVPQSRNCQ